VTARSLLVDPVSRQSFEGRYRLSEDPWNFRSSSYERAKYTMTVAALSRERYVSGFEPGCSIGELTALIAPHCARLLAMDVSPSAAAERAGKLALPLPGRGHTDERHRALLEFARLDLALHSPPDTPELSGLSRVFPS
jgi:hypothetical protein